MADAVDREDHAIGPADQAGKQPRAVLDAPVVMEKTPACALDQCLELRDLMGAAADIQDRDAREVESLRTRFRPGERGQMALDEVELMPGRSMISPHGLEGAVLLPQRRRKLARALVAAFTTRGFAREPAVEVANQAVGRFPVVAAFV